MSNTKLTQTDVMNEAARAIHTRGRAEGAAAERVRLLFTEPFECGACGGRVERRSAAGLKRLVDGVDWPLPASLMVPRCGSCEESYMGPVDGMAADAAVSGMVAERARLVAVVRAINEFDPYGIKDQILAAMADGGEGGG